MNTRTQQILLHITGWMVFLTLLLLFSPESLSLHAYLTNSPTQRDLLAYLMVVVMFYLNFYWLIPRLYFRKKKLSFFLVGPLSRDVIPRLVTLEKEIGYIRNYIALQQTRFGSSIPLDFQILHSSSGHLPDICSYFVPLPESLTPAPEPVVSGSNPVGANPVVGNPLP